MNTYHIRVPFSGYSRGYHTVRDDTETNFDDATLERV